MTESQEKPDSSEQFPTDSLNNEQFKVYIKLKALEGFKSLTSVEVSEGQIIEFTYQYDSGEPAKFLVCFGIDGRMRTYYEVGNEPVKDIKDILAIP